jgi:hypothetical protein
MNSQKHIHSLISLEFFKMLYGIDDREDDLACFLLEAATTQIERYCMRRLVFKRITQGFDFAAGNCFQLLDYPVRAITKVELLKEELRERKEESEDDCKEQIAESKEQSEDDCKEQRAKATEKYSDSSE